MNVSIQEIPLGLEGPRDQTTPISNFHMGKLRSREEEGCTESVGLELVLEPSSPTSWPSAWLPQFTVSETWSVGPCGLSLGTAGSAREGGGVLLTSGVTTESFPRPRG